jgi:hypothetical protein
VTVTVWGLFWGCVTVIVRRAAQDWHNPDGDRRATLAAAGVFAAGFTAVGLVLAFAWPGVPW